MIYFVRHGLTDWNVEGKIQGQSDIPLNDAGREQARLVKEKLADVVIDKVYVSPLLRTQETAKIINERYQLPMHIEPSIMERNFGEFEGKYKDEIDFDGLWDFEKQRYQMEHLDALFDRVYTFLDRIQEEAFDHNILLVAHGGVSIPFQCYFDEENRKQPLVSLILKNCEVAQRESMFKKKAVKG